MIFLQRHRARVAVANFTWVDNSRGLSRVCVAEDWAGGLPDWTLIGAGATRLYIIAATHNEAFIRAMPVSGEGTSVLWRR